MKIKRACSAALAVFANLFDDFKTAYKGRDYELALYDIATEFRTMNKYNDELVSWETVYHRFLDICNERNVHPFGD